MTEEIQALAQALNSGEAECNGVKFIVMDQDTVYRFENNRMKKVAKTLLNKAKKFVNQAVPPHPGNDFDEEGNVLEEKPAPKPRGRKKAQPVQPVQPDELEDDFDEEPVPPPKPKRSRAKAQPVLPEIDINDYYNTKNRLEFVQQENERLNGKVKKLKQYKQILNKLSGIEYDDPSIPDPQPIQDLRSGGAQRPPTQDQRVRQEYQQVPQEYAQSYGSRNDSLFLF